MTVLYRQYMEIAWDMTDQQDNVSDTWIACNFEHFTAEHDITTLHKMSHQMITEKGERVGRG